MKDINQCHKGLEIHCNESIPFSVLLGHPSVVLEDCSSIFRSSQCVAGFVAVLQVEKGHFIDQY